MEANEDLYRRFVEEVWNDGNFDMVEDFVADDYVGHDPFSPEEIRGPDGVREFVQLYHAAFPDTHLEIDQVITTDDFVVARWTGSGTHEGDFLGIEPTGNPVTVTGIEINRVKDGAFVEGWDNYDAFGMFQQLGVVELPTA